MQNSSSLTPDETVDALIAIRDNRDLDRATIDAIVDRGLATITVERADVLVVALTDDGRDALTATLLNRAAATQTLVEQLLAFRRHGLLKATALVRDEVHATVRVHAKTAGWLVNSDVRYDRGRDLYDVTVHRIDMRLTVKGAPNESYGDVVATREFNGVYADSLADVVGRWQS